MRRPPLFLVIFLVAMLLGVFFRFTSVDITRFGKEPVKDLVPTQAMLDSGKPIFHGVLGGLGPEKTQVTLGPTYYYVLAFSLLFTSDPYSIPLYPLFLLAVFNLLAAFVTYKLCKDFFHPVVGFVAASLYVLAPWNIVHAATILTPPNLLPPLVILLFYCLFQSVIKHRDVFLIPAAGLLALLPQFHLVSVLMSVPVFLIILFFKRHAPKKYLLLSILVGLLVLSPYILYSLSTHNFSTFQYLGKREDSTYSRSFLEAAGIPFLLVTPYFGEYMLGEGVSLFQNPFLNYLLLFVTGLLVLLLFASVFFALRTYLVEKDKRYALLLIWLLVPPLLLALPGKNLSVHYFLMLYPVQFILIALFLYSLLQRFKISILSLVIFILLSYAFFTFSFYQYIDSSGGTKGLYESPYKFKLQVIDYVKQDSQGKPVRIFFYKYPKTALEYLFTLHGVPATFGIVNSLDTFEGDYLILDRYSRYSAGEKELTAEENALIDQTDKKTIKHFEIIKQFKNEEL